MHLNVLHFPHLLTGFYFLVSFSLRSWVRQSGAAVRVRALRGVLRDDVWRPLLVHAPRHYRYVYVNVMVTAWDGVCC